MTEKAKELLSNAGNICLFVKENCGDDQTARCMSEAIVAINDAVRSEEQYGTPSLREGCEAAMAYLRRVDNLPNDHMRKAFENAYEKVEAALDVSTKSRSSVSAMRDALLSVSREMDINARIECTEKGNLGKFGNSQSDLCKGCRARGCECWQMELKREVDTALSTTPDAICDSVSSAELEDLVAAVKELRDGMCQHCDMRDLCAEGEDGMSTTCNAMAKVKSFIERHERHETNDEAPF